MSVWRGGGEGPTKEKSEIQIIFSIQKKKKKKEKGSNAPFSKYFDDYCSGWHYFKSKEQSFMFYVGWACPNEEVITFWERFILYS